MLHADKTSSAVEAFEPASLADLQALTVQLEREQSLFGIHTSIDTIIDEEALYTNIDDIPEDDACPWHESFPDWEGPVLKIVDWKAAEHAFANRIARATPPEAKRLGALMELLRARSDYRKLARIPTDWRTRLDEMETAFPNFAEVVDYLRGVYALAEYGDGVPLVAPMLLNGPPGVGKSLFADYFARYVGSGLVTLRMKTAQTGSALSGSAEHWGNTKSGEVCNTLLEGDFANPVFFLDEVDKAMEGMHDPLMALYALLEPTTAKQFSDLSYPWLTLDASHILWICTSNDARQVPEPLLDRLRRFDVEQPTERQARKMVHYIFDRIVGQLPNVAGSVQLTPKALARLTLLSPRQIERALREAVGRALYHRRYRILEQDIPSTHEEAVTNNRMGFL